jgi:hypothetical protein
MILDFPITIQYSLQHPQNYSRSMTLMELLLSSPNVSGHHVLQIYPITLFHMNNAVMLDLVRPSNPPS